MADPTQMPMGSLIDVHNLFPYLVILGEALDSGIESVARSQFRQKTRGRTKNAASQISIAINSPCPLASFDIRFAHD